MQMCGECMKVYDESEYSRCPYCYDNEDGIYNDDEDTNNEFNEEPWTATCADCGGTGRTECCVCEGEGEVDNAICPACNGEGDMECPDCNGEGEATYHMGKKI